jgi:hypothetical protein
VRDPDALPTPIALPPQRPTGRGDPRSTRRPRAGDWLPDETVVCDGRTVRLHALTAQPGIHVLLSRDAEELDGDELGGR